MPASQTVKYHRSIDVDVSVRPMVDHDIYFTDQSPEFELVVENNTDRPIESYEDNGLYVVFDVGEGSPNPDRWETLDIEVAPGEEQRLEIGGDLLAYEGSGVVGVTGVSLRGGAVHDPIVVNGTPPSRGNYRWLYTFRVWDRSNYHAIHKRPRNLLIISALLTGGVFLAAILQLVVFVYSTIGWP